MTLDDVGVLACPSCRGRLRFAGTPRGAEIAEGSLDCEVCGRAWPVREGVPRLVDEPRVSRVDRSMRTIYDWFAPVHDAAVRHLLPLLQLSSEAALRDAYMRRIELERLRPRRDGTPVRILEVGVGAGANLPLIARRLPKSIGAEVWGLDLSEGMLRQCRRTSADRGSLAEKYVVADAHALPFAEASFDRVFHVGGIAGFGRPATALAEMARVARRGTPIVVVDEQLEPAAARCLYQRAAFAVFALFAPDHGSPVAHLPPGARHVVDEQISAFYYCLSFSMAPSVRRRTATL